MRINKPQPFDPQRQYNPGERAVYRNMVIVAKKWDKKKEDLANEPRSMYPGRCTQCEIQANDCLGGGCKCDEYVRTDKKRIYFKKLYGLKTLLYKKEKSDERK